MPKKKDTSPRSGSTRGGSAPAAPGRGKAGDPAGRYQAIARAYFDRMAELDPVRSTELGMTLHDTRLPSGGRDAFEARVVAMEKARDELAALEVEGLDPEARLDVEVVANEARLHRFLFEKGTYLRSGRDPAVEVGESIQLLFSRDTRPAEARAEAITARLAAAPRFIEEAKSRYLRPVRFWVEATIRSCAGTGEYLDEVARDFPARLEGKVPPGRKKALDAALVRAAGSAKAALAGFAQWLGREVLPSATHSLAIGAEAMDELLAIRQLGYTADELTKLGKECFQRYSAAYRKELKKLYPKLDQEAAEAAWLATGPDSFEELLELYREAVASSRDFTVSRLGLPVPGPEALVVQATPEFMRPHVPSAAYLLPERFAKGTATGYYWVTPPPPGQVNPEKAPGAVYNTSLHEGYPGHHLQLSWANAQPSLFRAWLSGDEFCEGWAHYCEEMASDEGYAPVPGMQAAWLKDAIFRAVRIDADLGLQTGRRSYEQTVDFLVEEGRIARARARGEAHWYSFSPGYPLGYLTGKILLQELRKRETRRLGKDFDPRTFHSRILQGGTMPVWAHARRLALGQES